MDAELREVALAMVGARLGCHGGGIGVRDVIGKMACGGVPEFGVFNRWNHPDGWRIAIPLLDAVVVGRSSWPFDGVGCVLELVDAVDHVVGGGYFLAYRDSVYRMGIPRHARNRNA